MTREHPGHRDGHHRFAVFGSGRGALTDSPAPAVKREAEEDWGEGARDIKSPAYKDGAKLGKHVAIMMTPYCGPSN